LLDHDLIEDLLSRIEDHVQKLALLAALPKEQYLADFTKIESAKHLLQVSVQSCLDISSHIVAAQGFRRPDNYADTFAVLCENGIIPIDFLQRLRNMAGFRNRLVHLYWDVDNEGLLDILRNDLGDFEVFARYIASYVRRQQS